MFLCRLGHGISITVHADGRYTVTGVDYPKWGDAPLHYAGRIIGDAPIVAVENVKDGSVHVLAADDSIFEIGGETSLNGLEARKVR